MAKFIPHIKGSAKAVSHFHSTVKSANKAAWHKTNPIRRPVKI